MTSPETSADRLEREAQRPDFIIRYGEDGYTFSGLPTTNRDISNWRCVQVIQPDGTKVNFLR